MDSHGENVIGQKCHIIPLTLISVVCANKHVSTNLTENMAT